MSKRLLLLTLLAAPVLFAQTADLRIVSLTTDKSDIQTGERFTVSMRWRNDGPDAAQGVVVTLGEPAGTFLVTGAGTSGWPCEPENGGTTFLCRGNIAPNAEAGMVVTLLAPANRLEFPNFAIRGSISSQTTDPRPENNTASKALPLTDSNSRAEISISPRVQTYKAAPGTALTIPFSVRNAGPDTARDLIVSLGFGPGVTTAVSASGEGWSCSNQTHSPWLAVCMRERLDAGTSAPLIAHVTAPATPLQLTAHIRAQGFGEDTGADNIAVAEINETVAPQPGTPLQRILVPLTGSDVPGQSGALWRTETTALIASEIDLGIRPGQCQFGPTACTSTELPRNTPFDALRIAPFARAQTSNGQFLYVDGALASRLRLNSRVYDVSRTEQTAGSEIPIVRGSEFTSEPLAITGIPLAPHYRHTLRIYDLDGRDGVPVAIRIYVDGEATPRTSLTGTLVLPQVGRRLIPDDLPTLPTYLQLDPAQVASLAGGSKMRIDVEPLEGDRIWAFVSVTNNETHHVTTFSAQ